MGASFLAIFHLFSAANTSRSLWSSPPPPLLLFPFFFPLQISLSSFRCYMATFVRNVLQKLPDQRILTYFNHGNPLTFVPHPILEQPKFDNCSRLINPNSGCTRGIESTHKNGFQFYPSFSFDYCLNPVSPSGFCQSQSLEQSVDSDESRTMWADSVKKKRKRKMNKHKLRKLRKRLRGHS